MTLRSLPLIGTLILVLLAGCGQTGAPAATNTIAASQPSATAAPPTAASTPTAATAEGRELRVLCSVIVETCEGLIQAFEAETGIATTMERLSSGAAIDRLREHKDAPEFDVLYGGPAESFVAAGNEGLLQPYKSPAAIPVQELFKDPAGVWTGVYLGVLGFCSNQKVLDELGVEAPTSWDDLLDPKLKGHISMSHPATSGTAYTAIWSLVVLKGGPDQAFEYLEQLHQNIGRYTPAGAGPAEMASTGEAAVGITFSHACVSYMEDGSADLVTSFPSEGTGFEIGSMAIVAGANHQQEAQQFFDWALSADAQELLPATGSHQLPTNPEAEVSEKAVSIIDIDLITIDLEEAGAARTELTERFTQQIAPAPEQ